MQKSFLQSLLIKASSFLAAVFSLVGLIFLYASHFGAETSANVGLGLTSIGVVLAIVSLSVTNFLTGSLQTELKESTQLAHQIAEGEILDDFYEGETDERHELKALLHSVALDLKEKSMIAEQIGNGDLSAEIKPRSEADAFNKSFQTMIEKLRLLVQTEEKRDRLQKSILKLLDEVTEVASGDLTVQAEGTSELTVEIAEAFNFMTAELRSLIGQVKEVTFQIGNSAKAINETTEQLARGSEAQASQITLMTSTVTNMAMQVQEVSNNASLSAQVAGDSLSNARYGSQAVQDNISAMNSIRNQVQETAKRIKKLGERSQEISQIVQLIDDLSDRTSLLALNASLQAAAAGESGRGFAVVAEEVERLAERSNRLTQQIATLTQMIQIETKDVVASMEETIHEVVVGSTLADKAGQALIEIEQVSQHLAQLIGSISESAKEQERNSADISGAMANIAKVTELVNVGSKRAADSVKLLVILSDELRGSVAPFKLPDEKKRRQTTLTEPSQLYLN
jgi:methyl-accepting chemotaxis protein